MRRPSLRSIVTALVVAGSATFVLLQLEPSLLIADNTPAGGDTAAHVWAPDYLREVLLPSGRITGWAPDWYAGFPAFAFYFPLPSLLIVFLDLFLPYGVAFKVVTVLGAVTLPVAAWAFGRLSTLRFPGPPLLAVATLPFLFDTSFTIYGGNIPSTLAGEFAFSISLSLSLVFLGVVARGIETGRYRAWAALLLALAGLSHLIPTMFAVAAALVLLILRFDGRRLWYVASFGAVAACLVAFWALPFVWHLPYTNDMGWTKITDYFKALFPGHLTWLLPLAAAGVIAALGLRLHTGIALAGIAVASGLTFVLMPQGRLWNARLLPFWFLCLYLLGGVGVSEIGRSVGGMLSRDPERPSRWPGLLTPPAALVAALIIVGGPLQALPSFLPVRSGVRASFVPKWASWNYSGYESKPAYPEYRQLVETMARLPCGRAMWEYSRDLNRYGSPMALMLLPYWTDGCIASMEGLYFESTASVPFHFLNQSELSAKPSRPQRGLPYGDLDVETGVRHLQMWGVRYFMAFSSEVLAEAEENSNLRRVGISGPWRIYEVSDAPLVAPLEFEPAVATGADEGRREWLEKAIPWYQAPSQWEVPLAADGPGNWVRVSAGDDPPRRRVRQAVVSAIRASPSRVSFEVSRPGSPVVVKASYFPNWKVRGGRGPWRVTPNHMVVVPTAREVELFYGSTAPDLAGWIFTLIGLVAFARLIRRPIVYPALGSRTPLPAGNGEALGEQEPIRLRARRLLRRFAVVAVVVTALDVTLVVALRLITGMPVIVAGAISVTLASLVSYLLHRSITFGDDPHIRWVSEPATFVWVTVAAGVIDVGILRTVVEVVGSTTLLPLLTAKVAALTGAGMLRFIAYRSRLFRVVRRRLAEPVKRLPPPGILRLSVVLPAFCEATRIALTVRRVRQALAPLNGDFEIVVVNDGSWDSTSEVARAAGAELIDLPHHRGKGAAVKAGVLAARGRTVAFTDADLSYPPEQILGLLREIEAGWDLVVGSRKHIHTKTLVASRRLRELSGRVYNTLTGAVLLGQYRDTQCGLKGFRSDVAKVLFAKSRIEGFAFDVEIFHLAERYRFSLREIPVTVATFEASTVRVVVDALRMIRDLFRVRIWSGLGLYDPLPEDLAALHLPQKTTAPNKGGLQ